MPGHAKEVARKTRGLEAALIDNHVVMMGALDPADVRAFDVAIAGPTALLIAKAHKIAERVAEREHRRLEDKDALDMLRLLQATDTAVLADMVRTLPAGRCGARRHARGPRHPARAFHGCPRGRSADGGSRGRRPDAGRCCCGVMRSAHIGLAQGARNRAVTNAMTATTSLPR